HCCRSESAGSAGHDRDPSFELHPTAFSCSSARASRHNCRDREEVAMSERREPGIPASSERGPSGPVRSTESGGAVSEYDQLLVDAYRGEVLGAALFSAMAADRTEGEREQLLALARVESRTAERLRTLIDADGIDAGDDATAVDGGVEMA